MANYSVQHSGIKGMKWGIRRYQNEDGSLTPEGRARYGVEERQARRERFKSVAKKVGIGLGAAAAIGGAAYGGVKLHKWLSNPNNVMKLRVYKNRGKWWVDHQIMKLQKVAGDVGKAASGAAAKVGDVAKTAGKAVADTATNVYGSVVRWGDRQWTKAVNHGGHLYRRLLGTTSGRQMGR